MSSRRKFYVLYSLIGDMMPKIYKSKASVKKYLDSNPNLGFYEFMTEREAEDYIKNLKIK
jgi:hypothetical protein